MAEDPRWMRNRSRDKAVRKLMGAEEREEMMNSAQYKKLWEIMSVKTLDQQLEQAIEEASEFILAAQKVKRFRDEIDRWDNLREETGDLLIMMEQMRGFLGMELVDKSIDFKLNRELERIKEKK